MSPISIMVPTILAAMLCAQPGTNRGRPPTRSNLTPAGGGDADALARGLANDTSSIDDGVGFGKVYELPRRPGQPRRFARISGATIAVFPYSTYVSTKDGEIPSIPPGTTYYIGGDWIRKLTTPFETTRPPGLLAAPTAVDMSSGRAVQTQAGMQPVTIEQHSESQVQRESQGQSPRSIWTDESFRRERLADLLGA